MHWAFWWRRVRHPLFADVAATPAASAGKPCAALVGTFAELERAAASQVAVARAVFVLVTEAEPYIDEAARQFLWEAFGVPSFALLTDGRGRVLAYECEAFSGLHVTAAANGSRHARDASPCECGRPGERLVLHPSACAAD